MHMSMPRMSHGSGGHWGEPYVKTWHGEGTRLFLWHVWPMIGVAWLLFMLGVMMGSKATMMKQHMGAGPHGPGSGRKGMGHHHHGEGSSPCFDPNCAPATE